MAAVTAEEAALLADGLGVWAGDIEAAQLARWHGAVTARGNVTGQRAIDATLALAYRHLLARYGRLHRRQAGNLREDLNQAVDNLAATLALYTPALKQAFPLAAAPLGQQPAGAP